MLILDWFDYRSMVRNAGEYLGSKVSDCYELFPRDINEKHEQIMKLFDVSQINDSDCKIRTIREEWLKYHYENDHFTIISQSSFIDL